MNGWIERNSDDVHQPFQGHPHQKRNSYTVRNQRFHGFDLPGVKHDMGFDAGRLTTFQNGVPLEKIIFQQNEFFLP